MSTSAADGAHEFVVAPDLAEVAERLGVPLHAGTESGSRSSTTTGTPNRAAGVCAGWAA